MQAIRQKIQSRSSKKQEVKNPVFLPWLKERTKHIYKSVCHYAKRNQMDLKGIAAKKEERAVFCSKAGGNLLNTDALNIAEMIINRCRF